MVTPVENEGHRGGRFTIARKAPGKEKMNDGLESIEGSLRSPGATVILGRAVTASIMKGLQLDLLVWATGAV
ncbi:MAG: hypothetical protein P8X68_22720 [Desulfobacterales bacterium]